MGENGAGKSTLMKVLSGVYQKDGGTITVDGMPIEIHSPVDSVKMGIAVIYQSLPWFLSCRSPRTSLSARKSSTVPTSSWI